MVPICSPTRVWVTFVRAQARDSGAASSNRISTPTAPSDISFRLEIGCCPSKIIKLLFRVFYMFQCAIKFNLRIDYYDDIIIRQTDNHLAGAERRSELTFMECARVCDTRLERLAFLYRVHRTGVAAVLSNRSDLLRSRQSDIYDVAQTQYVMSLA
ncbi:hypothetical protein EVAR_28097_1 [Eumeta japonica]|uniref:Uncharacterized protein n=1 Tax=Eumeta variegata TaxID=151549 RepID=A0A4C1WC16_EUMVA|nr:hypothetical protein EVAR_28097_1 [Eumeta japonica]